jgi:hypothetical protein
MPTATPPDQVEAVLAEAVARKHFDTRPPLPHRLEHLRASATDRLVKEAHSRMLLARR